MQQLIDYMHKPTGPLIHIAALTWGAENEVNIIVSEDFDQIEGQWLGNNSVGLSAHLVETNLTLAKATLRHELIHGMVRDRGVPDLRASSPGQAAFLYLDELLANLGTSATANVAEADRLTLTGYKQKLAHAFCLDDLNERPEHRLSKALSKVQASRYPPTARLYAPLRSMLREFGVMR